MNLITEENEDMVRLEDFLTNDKNFHRSQNATELRQMIEEAELEEDEPIEEEKKQYVPAKL